MKGTPWPLRAEPVDLAFSVAGEGPPLLLLHGLFASAAHWCEVAAALARTHRVHSIDLRNHGRSPPAADMSYLSMADDLLRLVEAQGLQRPAIVGHSMGGKVAMALALTAPYAVGPLVVIDVAPVDYGDSWPLWTMPRLQAHEARVDWRSNLPAIGLSPHELCGFPRHLRHLSTALPLHAIAGSRSHCVRPATAAAYQPMFPQARVEVIEGAGHWVHADRPQALIASLQRALGVGQPDTLAA